MNVALSQFCVMDKVYFKNIILFISAGPIMLRSRVLYRGAQISTGNIHFCHCSKVVLDVNQSSGSNILVQGMIFFSGVRSDYKRSR